MKSFHRFTLLAAPRYWAYLKTQATGERPGKVRAVVQGKRLGKTFAPISRREEVFTPAIPVASHFSTASSVGRFFSAR
jgi:hypothetical protein